MGSLLLSSSSTSASPLIGLFWTETQPLPFGLRSWEFTTPSWEARTVIAVIAVYAVRLYLLLEYYVVMVLFSKRTRENQTSRTLLFDKGFCSCFLKRSETSLQGQVKARVTASKTYRICKYQVAAEMHRINLCIYSKLGNRAACNTNQNRCRNSQKKLSENERE